MRWSAVALVWLGACAGNIYVPRTPRLYAPRVEPAWATRGCPRVAPIEAAVRGRPGHSHGVFAGCSATRPCLLALDEDGGRLEYTSLDATGVVRQAVTLPAPPQGAALSSSELVNFDALPWPTIHAAPGERDVVLITRDGSRATTVARIDLSGATTWTRTIAGVTAPHSSRVAVTPAMAAALTVQGRGVVTLLARASGEELARADIGEASEWPAVCLTAHGERLFAATLRRVSKGPRFGLHGVLEGLWIDASSRAEIAPVAVPEGDREMTCAPHGDGIALVMLSSSGLYFMVLDATGAVSVPARKIAAHEPRRAGFYFTAPQLASAGDLQVVTWEFRPASREGVGPPMTWLTLLDPTGRPTRIRSLGRGSRNAALAATTDGVMLTYEDRSGGLSVARVGCER